MISRAKIDPNQKFLEWFREKAAEDVSKLVLDPDSEIACLAVSSLSEIGGQAAVNGVRNALKSREPEVVRNAIKALTHLKDWRSTSKVIQITRSPQRSDESVTRNSLRFLCAMTTQTPLSDRSAQRLFAHALSVWRLENGIQTSTEAVRLMVIIAQKHPIVAQNQVPPAIEITMNANRTELYHHQLFNPFGPESVREYEKLLEALRKTIAK